jgi:hypothetical protein
MDGKRKGVDHACVGKKACVEHTGELAVFDRVLPEPDEVRLPDKNTYHFISYSTYLPNWRYQEALRELLSNAIDQCRAVADKFGILGDLSIREEPDRLALHIGKRLLAEVKWKYGQHDYRYKYRDITAARATKRRCGWSKNSDVDTMCIDVINYTSHLQWESFLLGKTTKRGSKNMIGTHGEGLSGAAIVLNRLGCDFVVHCDNYSGRVVNLGDRVYILPTNHERRKKADTVYKNAVHFKIVLPPPGNLFDVSKLITEIRLSATVTRVVAQRGQLLTTPEYRGKQYNRGIYVAESPKYLFGYNFLDPDKNLLQSRDRNLHAVDAAQRECGSILSEAILQSEEVCQRILECFVYTTQPAAGAASTLPVCVDLADGQYLTLAAQQHLRAHQAKLRGGQEALFCGGDTDLIVRVSGALNMPVVYCHPVLHNHAKVTNDFFQQLKDTAVDLPSASRCAAHQEEICKLMRVDKLRASSLNMSTKLVGFWRVGEVGYVTGLHNLQSEERLSQENEVNIHETLRACKADLRGIIQIVRCLQSEAQRDRANMRCDPALLDELKAEMEEKVRREWEERAAREREEAAAAVAAAAALAAATQEAEELQTAAAQQASDAAAQATVAVVGYDGTGSDAARRAGSDEPDGSSVHGAVSEAIASAVSTASEDAADDDDGSSDGDTASSCEDDEGDEGDCMHVSDDDGDCGTEDECDSSSDYEPNVASLRVGKTALVAEPAGQLVAPLLAVVPVRPPSTSQGILPSPSSDAAAAQGAIQTLPTASVAAVAAVPSATVAPAAMVLAGATADGRVSSATGSAGSELPNAGLVGAAASASFAVGASTASAASGVSTVPSTAPATSAAGTKATAPLLPAASSNEVDTGAPTALATDIMSAVPLCSSVTSSMVVGAVSDAPVGSTNKVTSLVNSTATIARGTDAVLPSTIAEIAQNAAPPTATVAAVGNDNTVAPVCRTTASSSAASTSPEGTSAPASRTPLATTLQQVVIDLAGEDSDQDMEVVTVTSRARRRTSRSPIVFLSPPQTPRSTPFHVDVGSSAPVRVPGVRTAGSTYTTGSVGDEHAKDASGQTSPALTDNSDASSDVEAEVRAAAVPAEPVAFICLPMPSAAGGLGGGMLQLTYCATDPSGVLLYDSLDDPATLQKHCEQLHQHKDMAALLTKLCTHYSFQVVLFRAAQATPPLAFRLWQKVLFVNVTEGGSEAGERAVEDLRSVLRSITLLDALLM